MKPRIFLIGKGQWLCGITRQPNQDDSDAVRQCRWVMSEGEYGVGNSPEHAFASWQGGWYWTLLHAPYDGAGLN